MNDLVSLNPALATDAQDDARIADLRMIALQSKGRMSDRQMHKIADQFETMMYRMLMKEMRKTIPEDGYLEKSHSMEMFMDISDDYLTEYLAENNDLGIEGLIYQELKDRNDKIVEKDELPQDNRMVPLHGQQVDKGFVSIHPSTDRFIDLQHPPHMVEIPPSDKGFVHMEPQHRVNSGKIDPR